MVSVDLLRVWQRQREIALADQREMLAREQLRLVTRALAILRVT